MKNKYLKIILITIFIFLIIFGSLAYYYFFVPYKVDKDFSKLDLSKINKIMIVAHPDDELLWGGGHLIEDDYLVVCITCGPNKTRVHEFENVMKNTNDAYVMLGYPDKTNGERDNWNSVRDDINKDLQALLTLKNWDVIVTHNPDGEYGHIHHKMTSSFVTELTTDKKKLYYFGHYYSKKKISEHESEMSSISDKTLKIKTKLIGLYKSQSFIQTAFDHMYEHEDWETYDEWMSELNEKSLE